MKLKLTFVAFLLSMMGLVLLFGCTSSPIDLAKTVPQVKEYLTQHPNATVSLSAYSAADFTVDANFWNTNCAAGIAAGEYYLLKAEDTNSTLKALFDKANMNFLCGVAENNQSTSIQNIGTAGSPKSIYLEYKAKFDQMKTFSDYNTLVQQYGSQTNVQKIPLVSAMPEEQIDGIFNLMMSTAPKLSEIDTPNIQENISGNTATLSVTTKSGTPKATISLVKENGSWKIDKESWTANLQQCAENWACGEWSSCNNNVQTRTCVDSNNCGTTSNKPTTNQQCSSTCTEDWSCNNWSDCVWINGQQPTQTRTCTDTKNCGTTASKPNESQNCCYIRCDAWGTACVNGKQYRSCDIVGCTQAEWDATVASSERNCQQGCTENWTCSSWSSCNNSTQTRTCTDASSCGTVANKPTTTQSCTVACTENWTCSAWSTCTNNTQSRTCTDSSNCGTQTTKPETQQSCTPAPSNCTDSDGGANYYVKGITVGPFIDQQELGPVTKEDFCSSANYLQEFTCETIGDRSGIMQWGYPCPNGCEAGVCKS